MNTEIETCPVCDEDVEVNENQKGYVITCPHCKKKMTLCGRCMNDTGYCDFHYINNERTKWACKQIGE